jgi:hypothetical protein
MHRLGVARLAGLQLLVAVVKALIALVGTVGAVNRTFLVDVTFLVRMALLGNGRSPSDGGERGASRPEGTQQFSAIHRSTPQKQAR